jgi:cold shock CspA family protein
VSHYDDDAGLGTVEAGGAMRYPFHCTAIADGSRHIDAGVRVRFVLAPGHAGRIEARELVPLSGGDASEGSGPALP